MKTSLLYSIPFCLFFIGCGKPTGENSTVDPAASELQAAETATQAEEPKAPKLTPMDVVGGVTPPTGAPQTPPNAPPALPPGVPTPDFNKILGEGNWELKEVHEGVAGPGEGPRGPDGKVIDPKEFLKQLQEAQKAQGTTQKAPIPAPPLPPIPSAKPLDPSQAPTLPGSAADKKAE